MVVVFATGLLPVSAQNDATNRPPVQTFYLPIPEEDLLDTLTKIHGGANWTLPAEPIESYNSIVVFVDGTVIYYDQWEDGYEQDIANPNHIYSASNPTGTQIWGDGDPSTGYPPNYPNDKLYAGNVIVLSSEVKVNGRNPAKQVFFDGSDKIGVSRPVAITRAVWLDANRNGIQDADEVPVAGIVVSLVDENGALVLNDKDIPGEGDDLDFGYFHMRATPPYNTVTIDLNGAGARFFKIRVDNLADEVR